MTNKEGTIRLELIEATRSAIFSGRKFKNDLITLTEIVDEMAKTGNCKGIKDDDRVKGTGKEFAELVSRIADLIG